MSYCVHCGVELERGTSACPLCQTPIYDPSDKDALHTLPSPLYPANPAPAIPKVSRRVIFVLLALLYLIPTGVAVLCDLSLGGGISWSALVIGAAVTLTADIAVLLYAAPLRAYGKVLVSGALWSVYTLFVGYWIYGDLRIPFALPLVVYTTLSLATLCLVARLQKRRPLLIVALFFLFTGGGCVLIEYAIHVFFALTAHAPWCIYPAGTAALLAAFFLVVDRSNSLKAKLKKKMFI